MYSHVSEHESHLKLTVDTTYLTLTGELWGVCCEDSGENLLHYNGTTLYIWTVNTIVVGIIPNVAYIYAAVQDP